MLQDCFNCHFIESNKWFEASLDSQGLIWNFVYFFCAPYELTQIPFEVFPPKDQFLAFLVYFIELSDISVNKVISLSDLAQNWSWKAIINASIARSHVNSSDWLGFTCDAVLRDEDGSAGAPASQQFAESKTYERRFELWSGIALL